MISIKDINRIFFIEKDIVLNFDIFALDDLSLENLKFNDFHHYLEITKNISKIILNNIKPKSIKFTSLGYFFLIKKYPSEFSVLVFI